MEFMEGQSSSGESLTSVGEAGFCRCKTILGCTTNQAVYFPFFCTDELI